MLFLAALTLAQAPSGPVEYPGQMFSVVRTGRVIMPLERTSVNAEIAGMGARVTVRQSFVNPSRETIEALYTFPLPHDAAVDRMRIKVGERVIDGSIMRREAAKKVYDAAKAAGQTAALLDQETDNVFTQSVANIRPGNRVEVEISYVQILKFENGQFEFNYPMVVGPRFLGKGTPNPDRISPPILPPGVRSGANIDLTVTLHGGAPIQEFKSVLHQVRSTRVDPETVRITLAKEAEIPNRDFILRYRTARSEVSEATFATWDPKKGGHFALVLAPPPTPLEELRAPKEMTFVIDQSGSQSGFPIDKSKELSLALLDTMGPRDTFNVMGFSNEVNPLWSSPQPKNSETLAEARAFIKSLQANGGTELEKAIVASLSPAPDPERLRVVLFNTDAYAGQESVILANVQKYRGTSRLFTFGIGNSVNRALIDAMSTEGRGASEVVTLAEGAEGAKKRFAERLETPLLVDVKAAFAENAVTSVTPAYLPDVFSAKPVVVYGRYTKPGKTTMTLSGRSGGRPWTRTITLDLPATTGDGSAVASMWARARLAEMKAQGYTERALGRKPENEEAMTKLALDYGILSETTSFVAVDRSAAGAVSTQTVQVPVEMADGVSLGQSVMAAPALRTGGFPGGRGGIGGGMAASGGRTQNGALRAKVGSGRGGAVTGGLVPPGIEFVTYDPTDNSLISLGSEKPKGRTVRIAKGLLEAKGTLELRIEVAKIDAATILALKKAGLRFGSHDGASLVFGRASAKQIREIAKLDFVRTIAPLRTKEE